MNNYYTYAYLREDGTPYYIGKGKDNRIFSKNRKGIRVPKDRNRIIFLKQNLYEKEAFDHEIYMIFIFGRKDLGTGILHNRTNGGDGVTGPKTEDYKRKMSEIMKGENNPSYGKRGKNSILYGKKLSEETKDKIRKSLTGRKLSEEHMKKLSECNKGEKNYFYGKSEYGGWNKGIPMSDESKKKLRESHSSWFIFKHKDGRELKLFTTLSCFCEENKLDRRTMIRVMNNEPKYNQHKGWTVFKLNT